MQHSDNQTVDLYFATPASKNNYVIKKHTTGVLICFASHVQVLISCFLGLVDVNGDISDSLLLVTFSVSLKSHSCFSGVMTSDSGMTESMGGKRAVCGMFRGKFGRVMYYTPKLFPDLLLDPLFQTQNSIANISS